MTSTHSQSHSRGPLPFPVPSASVQPGPFNSDWPSGIAGAWDLENDADGRIFCGDIIAVAAPSLRHLFCGPSIGGRVHRSHCEVFDVHGYPLTRLR